MTKGRIFALLAVILAVGVWLLWPEKPGLPEGDWTELPGEPAVWEDAAGVLENAQWQRVYTLTEGELQGGEPGGATLTVRWGASWTVPGDEMTVAWEASWSEPPRSGERQIALSWQGVNPEGQPLGFARRSYSAAARADGIYYRLADTLGTAGLSWPLPDRAEACRGKMELAAVHPSWVMKSARLTLTVTQGEQTGTDLLNMRGE